jgi:hypothetical protein
LLMFLRLVEVSVSCSALRTIVVDCLAAEARSWSVE